ncbi:MAG: hypothetical protein AB8F78_19715 [Saprospiraceae bacterium]
MKLKNLITWSLLIVSFHLLAKPLEKNSTLDDSFATDIERKDRRNEKSNCISFLAPIESDNESIGRKNLQVLDSNCCIEPAFGPLPAFSSAEEGLCLSTLCEDELEKMLLIPLDGFIFLVLDMPSQQVELSKMELHRMQQVRPTEQQLKLDQRGIILS